MIHRSALLATILLAGCGSGIQLPTVQPQFVPGNWQFSSSSPSASPLPALSGSLTGTPSAIAGVIHSTGNTACVSPSAGIAVTGSANFLGQVNLNSTSFAGSILTVKGQLSADGQSLQQASYSVTGGACAFATAAFVPALVTHFASIDGSYTGTFLDANGPVLTVAASLTQNPSSDPAGNFHLSGTGTFGTNPCFISPATVTNSQVTGGALNITYTDSTTLNTVVATGTFSTDGKTLTIANWALSGGCGADTGSGTLTRP